jgi:predicted RNA-binding Zn-ribbon protein involved in translation (DUF1610 family)
MIAFGLVVNVCYLYAMDVQSIFIFILCLLQFKHAHVLYNTCVSDKLIMNDNEIRKFQCSKCSKSSLVLKKVWDKQHHGFACDKCWTAIEGQRRYMGCSMQ